MLNNDESGCFFLTSKEEEVMRALWTSTKPISATEIALRIPNRKWPASSVQSIIRSLEKKNAIIVDKITKIGKSYGRLFRATVTANEYAVMQFNRYYDNENSILLSALLGKTRNKEDIAESADSLQEMLNKFMEE